MTRAASGRDLHGDNGPELGLGRSRDNWCHFKKENLTYFIQKYAVYAFNPSTRLEIKWVDCQGAIASSITLVP